MATLQSWESAAGIRFMGMQWLSVQLYKPSPNGNGAWLPTESTGKMTGVNTRLRIEGGNVCTKIRIEISYVNIENPAMDHKAFLDFELASDLVKGSFKIEGSSINSHKQETNAGDCALTSSHISIMFNTKVGLRRHPI